MLYATFARDARLLRVVAFGGTLGFALLWVLARVLVTWMDLADAARIGAAVIALAGVVAYLARRGAPAAPEPAPAGRGAERAVVAFALLAALVTFSATGVVAKWDEALDYQLPIVASMQRGNVPPIDPLEPPHALEYHWGTHLLAATLASLTGLPTHLALFGLNALLAALAVLSAHALAEEEAGGAGGLAAAVLMFGAGTFNWLSAPRFLAPGETLVQLMDPLGLPLTTGNTTVGSFAWRLHSNSTVWPACLALLSVELLVRSVRDRRPGLALVAAPVLALVAPGSETLACAMLAGVAALPLAQAVFERRVPAREALHAALAAGGAVLLLPWAGGVLATFLESGSASHQASVLFNRDHLGSVPSWDFARVFGDPAWLPIASWRFLQDAGPLPWLAVPVLAWALATRRPRLALAGLAACAALTAATTFTLTHYPQNTFRLVNQGVFLAAIPAGGCLAVLAARARAGWPRRAAVVAAVAFVLANVAGWPLAMAGLCAREGRWPWPPRVLGPPADRDSVAWLVAETDFTERTLPLPLGSRALADSGQVTPIGGYYGGRLQYRAVAQVAATTLDPAALDALGVAWVHARPEELGAPLRAALDEAVASGRLAVAHRSRDGGGAVYRVVR